MLILLDLPPQPPATVCGPPAPVLKGVTAQSAAFSLARASRAALREMPGAVVVIEENAPEAMQKALAMSLARGRLRLMVGKDLMGFPATPPMPVWMDPNVTMSGGNVAGRVYSFGGGGF